MCYHLFQVYFWSLPSCAGNQVLLSYNAFENLGPLSNYPRINASTLQLRNVHRKLEADLQNCKKRLAELEEQCHALKKGREESVITF